VNESFKESMGCNGRLGLQRLPHLQRLPACLPATVALALAFGCLAFPCLAFALPFAPFAPALFHVEHTCSSVHYGKRLPTVARWFSACFPPVFRECPKKRFRKLLLFKEIKKSFPLTHYFLGFRKRCGKVVTFDSFNGSAVERATNRGSTPAR
jgi:hypothetical protein